MTFLDISNLKHISKTHQMIEMITRADFSNKTTRNGLLQVTVIQETKM